MRAARARTGARARRIEDAPMIRLRAGLRFSGSTLLLILAIDTGIALVLWIDDVRPFWHPLLSVQLHGLAIAYCVNVAAPWDHERPLARLALATLVGSLIGVVLVIVVKRYSLEYVRTMPTSFLFNVVAAFVTGYSISLIFLMKRREARAAAALHQAEAAQHLLSKQAIEAELKLMQAQVEPHFLFNTLASVQYLIETDPPQAAKLLNHLLSYLRAAVPQLRTASATLGQELALADAYLSVLRMRMGQRLVYDIVASDELRAHPFPPALLITVVENAVTHGIEPQAEGGSIRIAALRAGERLVVSVIDTGRGLSAN